MTTRIYIYVRHRGVVGLWRSPRAASSRPVETWTPSNHGVRCETLLQWLHGTHNMISLQNFSFGPLNPLSIRQGRRAWASRGRVAGGAGGHSGTRLALMPPPLRAPIFANEKRLRNTAVRCLLTYEWTLSAKPPRRSTKIDICHQAKSDDTLFHENDRVHRRKRAHCQQRVRMDAHYTTAAASARARVHARRSVRHEPRRRRLLGRVPGALTGWQARPLVRSLPCR